MGRPTIVGDGCIWKVYPTGRITVSIGVALGVLTQLAAIGLILIMLGAIQKKIFVWKTGFWGERTYGWHYDLMLVVMNLVIVMTGGGKLVLLSWDQTGVL